MQPRSNLWKELAASGNVRLETSVTIGARTYTPTNAVSVDRAVGQTALSCGNCVSASARFSLAASDMEGATIPGASAAVVKCRFVDGERASEWLTVGTFYVSRRQGNPVNGQLEFEGFDAMQKANAPYPSLSGFPKAMNSAVMEIAHNMGVEVDGRTWDGVPTGGGYRVTLPADGEKMIRILGYIGGVCGGNWIITPRGKLRLVPFVSASGAANATDKAHIVGIMGSVTTGAALTVTGVEAATGSTRFFAGTDAGGIVSVPSNPYAKQALVNALLTKYAGLVYAPFEIKSGIYDPAVEIGDYIISRQDVAGVIYKESARYAPAFRGDLSAPFAPETSETQQSLTDSISDSGAVTEDLSIRIYSFTNQSAVTVGDGQSAEIVNFDYAAGVGQDVVFHAEVKHVTAMTETGNAATGWTYTDAVITVTYYINGKAVDSYHPVKTETDGANLLHLTYHFTNGQFNAGNFRASIALSGGSVAIAAGDANAYIIAQGYSGTDGNWITEDGLMFIGAESYPDKMSYTIGETLDLAGLVIKAYYADGTETDVTDDCTITPAAGSVIDREGETVVSVSYTEDGAEFRDSFSMYVDKGPVIASGDWWTLYETGLLDIYCEGDMPYDYGIPPWEEYYDEIQSAVIREGATNIGESAFDGYAALASVEIPDSVTSIGDYAFFDCSNLISVTIPDSVTSIGRQTFSFCSGLTSVEIPNSVTSIDDFAFSDCTSLTSVAIPNSVTSIGDGAFEGCINLISVTIPDPGINGYWFDAVFPNLFISSVTISDGAASISDGAFASCDIGAVTIPDSVTSIGDSAFSCCTSLTSATIGNGVASIGENAFDECYALESIVIPDSVTSIGYGAFTGTGLISLTIPNSVTSIGQGAFMGCAALTSVTVPLDATYDGYGFENVFYGCPGINSVVISDAPEIIPGGAFYELYNLESVVIPNSVTAIGDGAFENCHSLTDVYYSGTQSQWNAIEIGDDNDPLASATIHYNSSGPT